ncbi:FecR domain-containing protein [Comamonas flocculans]|uniref:FecR protein domain-containing protein n=1 Tax=Comamonas flocculans TaxID=2597701 RepID=A0A5B8RU88_9BURK|nr:FecR domain-containing protein [Comamonas flocculans]QEA12388.1 hypothetical protein FOZ74_04690 [Comamonas flocculans]
MRKRLAIVWAAMFGCLGVAWAQTPPCTAVADADGAAAQIVALSGQGQARAQADAPWTAATLSQRLYPGADMRTLALSSAALLLADRTQIRMAAQARIRLCDARPGQTRLELGLGRIWTRTKGQAAGLQLQTPAAVAAVRGTDWDVEVDAQGHTTLTVLSGLIAVSNAQGSVEVGPSEQASVAPGQAPVKHRLVNPRERVQWVMAPALVPALWPELDAAAPPWRARAGEALRAGQLQALQQQVDARLATAPDDALALRLRAELQAQDGRLEAAQQSLLALWQAQRDSRAAARRAQLLQALDRGDEAREFIADARRQAPQAFALLLADADARRLQGQGEAALALYRQAVAQARGEAEQAEAEAGLGRALLERGDLAAARETLARAVQRQGDNAEIRARAATADTQALHHAEAAEGFAAALAQSGDDYVALAGDGLLALQRGEAELARTQLLKALVIEPRYAQAQVWLAVAEYQLGNLPAALDALARARLADPNDPLPWQIESILRNDDGQAEEAIAAARQALVRLPYLKSLEPLKSDSQGSANLGKALADFGLEHWARAYAQQSYYPLWAGSHFFMADRYESSFARDSEMHQGYLADPLAFGASERTAPVLPVEGSEWIAGMSAERNPDRHTGAVELGHRGLTTQPVPMAWRVGLDAMDFHPRGGPFSPRMNSGAARLGLGIKPSDRLSLLLLHDEDRARTWIPGSASFSDGTLDGAIRQPFSRTDVGGSWRWSADSQTWLQWSRARFGTRYLANDEAAGPYSYRGADAHSAWMLRHTVQQGPMRWSAGWEWASVDLDSALSYSLVTGAEHSRLRYDMPWLAWEYGQGPWSGSAMASWPRLNMRYRHRQYLGQTGEDLSEPYDDAGRQRRRLRPRLGLSYRFAPGRALHFAYVESMYSPTSHTLAPVSVGAIPIDYQYQIPGSLARKLAMQLDWEIDRRSFAWLSLSHQKITNAQYDNGSMLYPLEVLYSDKVGSLGPLIQTAQTVIDAYNGDPQFDRGRLSQVAVAYNRILSPRWSVLTGYTWSHSRNTGEYFPGNALPGFPRHTGVLVNVWKHGGRDYTLLSLVYRSGRFTQMSNQTVEGAGWTLGLMHSMDLRERRWSLVTSIQGPLDGRVPPTFWLRLRWRS